MFREDRSNTEWFPTIPMSSLVLVASLEGRWRVLLRLTDGSMVFFLEYIETPNSLIAALLVFLKWVGFRVPGFNSPIDVCIKEDCRSVRTHLSLNTGDNFLFAKDLNFVYRFLTGCTSVIGDGERSKGECTSTKSRVGAAITLLSGLLNMLMMLSSSFYQAIRIDSSFV